MKMVSLFYGIAGEIMSAVAAFMIFFLMKSWSQEMMHSTMVVVVIAAFFLTASLMAYIKHRHGKLI